MNDEMNALFEQHLALFEVRYDRITMLILAYSQKQAHQLFIEYFKTDKYNTFASEHDVHHIKKEDLFVKHIGQSP